jgi:hypothetical protein
MKRFLTLANLRLAIEIILVIAALTFTLSRSMPTEAASAPAPEAPNALYWYACNAPATMHIGLFSNRIHVYCPTTTAIAGAPPIPAIFWFAVPTSPDSAAASRYLSLFQSAAISGRILWVQVDPLDTSGTSFGCGSGDCRRIYGAELR